MDEQDVHEHEHEPIPSPSSPSFPLSSGVSSSSRIPDVRSGQRFQTIATLSILVVVVLVILGTLTSLRDIVVQRFTGASPTPVPTLVPGDDKFFIQASPAWGTVTIDGHVLKKFSSPGQGTPLSTPPGITTQPAGSPWRKDSQMAHR